MLCPILCKIRTLLYTCLRTAGSAAEAAVGTPGESTTITGQITPPDRGCGTCAGTNDFELTDHHLQ